MFADVECKLGRYDVCVWVGGVYEYLFVLGVCRTVCLLYDVCEAYCLVD